MVYRKILASLLMVIGSFGARANSSLTELSFTHNFLNSIEKAREFLLTGDGILFIGFLLWIAYIVLFFPNDTLKKS